MRRTLASPKLAISSKIARACLWDVLSASIRTARSGVSLAILEYLRRQRVTARPPMPEGAHCLGPDHGRPCDIDRAAADPLPYNGRDQRGAANAQRHGPPDGFFRQVRQCIRSARHEAQEDVRDPAA